METDSKKIKADSIIFDLDGTLWDSTSQIADAWNELLKTRPDIVREPITRQELFSCMGKPMYDIAARLFPTEKEQVRNLLMDDMGIYENDYLRERGADIYEGVLNLIEELEKKVPLFIVSNCQSGYIEAFMDYYKLDKFIKDIECWGNTRESKGNNIKAVIERNNLKSPIYLGDTVGDCKASKEAGLPFIFASYGFGIREDIEVDDDCIIKEPIELLAKIELI